MYSQYVDQQINTFERGQRERQAAQHRLVQQCQISDGAVATQRHARLARWISRLGSGWQRAALRGRSTALPK